MPIYEYVCQECKEEIEVLQRLNDPPPKCEKCNEDMEKIMSLSSFALKGTGWYATDYGNKKKIGKTDSSNKPKADKIESKT